MGQPKPVNLDDDFESVFADELEPGHQLMQGQYIIESFLNAGGFGITYRAKDSLDRPVVIKECFPGSFCRRTTTSVQPRSRAHSRELSSIVNLFVQEARSLARLNHPNIVGVHQVFEENNTAYMALDFVEGKDLLDRIENPEDVLEPDQVEAMLAKLLDAVGFIHDQGVLHRDISPDNVLLKPDLEPILIDFGAAREEASKQSRVLSALRVVKDGYSPQEFYISGSEQGPFSDLYALGATFYHLITGELPANSQARLSAVASGEPDPYQPVSDRMPAYSERFLKGIDKSLEILPKDRIESAAQWQGLLDGSLEYADFEKAEVKAKRETAATEAKKKSSMKAILLASVALMVPFAGYVFVNQGSAPAVAIEAPEAPEVAAAPVAVVAPAPTPTVAEPEPELNGVAAALALQAAASAAAAAEAAAAEEAVVPEAVAPAAVPSDESSSLVVPDAAPVVTTVEDVTAPAFTEAYVAASVAVAEVPAPADAQDYVSAPAPETVAPAVPGTLEAALAAAPVVESVSIYLTPQSYGFAPDSTPVQPAEASVEVAVSVPVLPAGPEIELVTVLRPKVRPDVETLALQIAPEAPLQASATTFAAQPFVKPEGPDELPVVDVSIPAQPEPAGIDPALLEVFDLPKILSGWTVELPAEITSNGGSVFAINGYDVASLKDIDSLMSKTFAAPLGATSNVEVLSGQSRDEAQLQTVAAPVVQRTLFLNGLFIETRQIDGDWVSQVITAPQIGGMQFAEGDIIVGDLATGTRFDQRTSLPDLLVQAKEQRRAVITLAVSREGQVLTLDLPAPQ